MDAARSLPPLKIMRNLILIFFLAGCSTTSLEVDADTSFRIKGNSKVTLGIAVIGSMSLRQVIIEPKCDHYD